MSESDVGATGAFDPAGTTEPPHLTIRGVPLTDLSAGVGAAVWLVATVAGGLDLVEMALALAALVLVPLGMGMAATPHFVGTAGTLFDAAAGLQPVGAVLLLASLLSPSGGSTAAVLAAGWIPVAGLLGLAGLARTLDRGVWPLSETVIDGGFAYTIVGAVALVLYHLGITFWFSPVIVLLTAVHFHYAGFVLPVATGLTGRCATETDEPLVRVLTGTVLVGPAVIGLGIAFSPLLELVSVAAFTVAVAVLAGYVVVRIAPTRSRAQGVLLSISALTLPLSMALALGFVLRTVVGFDPLGLTIPRMIVLHGTVNAFGFALLAMVGWRLAVPPVRR